MDKVEQVPAFRVPLDAAVAIHAAFLKMRVEHPTPFRGDHEDVADQVQDLVEALGLHDTPRTPEQRREKALLSGAVAMAILMEVGNE